MKRSFLASPWFIALGTVFVIVPLGIVLLFVVNSGIAALLAMVGCFAVLMIVKNKEDKKYEMTEKVDSCGQTMLFNEFCTIDQVDECVKLGADVNARDFKNRTPLHAHVEMGHAAVSKILLLDNADVNARDLNEQTPLFLVKNLKTAEVLLEHNADVNARDKDNISVLAHLKKRSEDQNISESEHKDLSEIIQYLESKGAQA